MTSSDVYGVVVMVSWPSAVSNGPEEAIVDCLCFALVRPHRRAFGAKERKLGFVYAVRACCGPALTSSDVFGVVVMVSWPSAVPNGPEEAIVDCVCLAFVRPHRRGIWG